ncbi:30S ribosomal protein S1 [Paraclostridium sordellii]|uniref:30S ribosomal protein S1 n=1 Tax=Paraclostridium sordellii TaxID=1505 RepID=UPI0005E0402D|nr:S1 RNA-binding domain-containing protein [Paeniclostridium sordellii]QYE98401.1 S1 RNA-binding domain-containing protein [Paeniclostridium sordellii]CEO10783.1 30S ribosomal protein S1 [[Clostridium] sordellii] [Paeniclostridium sordellii]CEP85977.1 30S ribosomal protein S1 [[Clostridium] sordellii] [Paeniclostridium sordellii]CEP95279.1 30S ribosomal protein S1 [[Clostridium] sordellii] [Paeniclostridium sordellii]CEP98596.1 30S ribosomal protein S1 [[Clostridium] sordellii] [Paeniclostrid
MDNNQTMEELLAQQEKEMGSLKIGQIVTGKITKVLYDEIRVELNYGFDGIILKSELVLDKNQEIKDKYEVGKEISGEITKVQRKDGIIYLSVKKAVVEENRKELKEALDNHTILTVHVERSIEKGLFANYKTETVFIPLSQIDVKFVNNTAAYIGRDLEVYMIEMDLRRNRIVASHREVAQERLDIQRAEERARIKAEKEAHRAKVKKAKEDLFNSLEIGQKRTGKVSKIMSYGAFIDLGGIEGLAHINELAWHRVDSVEDVVKEGQEVDVYVIKIDKENKKVGLAIKDINNDPWNEVRENMQVGDIVKVKVLKLIEKGAFVEVKLGVEAFLPISELSEERVMKVSHVVNIDDEIEVMIIDIKNKEKRMVVSLKEANKEPEEDYSEFLETEESLGSLGELFKEKFKDLK